MAVHLERDRPRSLRRLDAVASWALDGAIALVLFPLTAGAYGHGLRHGSRGSIAIVLVAAGLSVLPLLVRRRWPVQVLVAIVAVGVLAPGPAAFSPAALVAVYTIASRRPWRMAVLSAAVVATAFALHPILWGYDLALSSLIAGIALAAAAVALGLYQATRLAYVEQLHERADRLERERELLGEQAAAQERLRIARELHDVVAHNVSLMVIHAQAVGATAGDEAATRASVQTIAELGRGAMSEMHRTLELMRAGGSGAELSPQPTLDDLGALLAQARAAGLSAELTVKGRPRPLPAGVELSAYRIVQEALTNVIKHAGSTDASVIVNYGERALELEIVDHGRGVAEAAVPGSRHGLVGMRERVALFGGTLRTGPLDGRGYRVEALLPYGE